MRQVTSALSEQLTEEQLVRRCSDGRQTLPLAIFLTLKVGCFWVRLDCLPWPVRLPVFDEFSVCA